MKRSRRVEKLSLLCAAVFATAALAQSANETLPIADLHFHADRDMAPDAVLAVMDRAGVRWAGAGPKGADTAWRPYVDAAPDRFIPFGGQGAIGTRVQAQGEVAWTLQSPDLTRYLEVLEQGLRSEQFRGIGELFVNNEHTHARDFQPTHYPADSALMRRLLALSATYHVPLSVHMEAEPASVEELERLLALDPKAVVIWAHCGFWVEADRLQTLMDRNPNLLCELSHRDDRAHAPKFRGVPITGPGRKLKADWKAVMESHSDRFLVGTDVDALSQYPEIIAFYRAILVQLAPDAARNLAHGNAMRLFALRQ